MNTEEGKYYWAITHDMLGCVKSEEDWVLVQCVNGHLIDDEGDLWDEWFHDDGEDLAPYLGE